MANLRELIPDNIDPSAIREEADRRALVARHEAHMKRRAARGALVDAILGIPREIVRDSEQVQRLLSLIKQLETVEADDEGVANSEVWRLGNGWWEEYTAHIDRVSVHRHLAPNHNRRLTIGSFGCGDGGTPPS